MDNQSPNELEEVTDVKAQGKNNTLTIILAAAA